MHASAPDDGFGLNTASALKIESARVRARNAIARDHFNAAALEDATRILTHLRRKAGEQGGSRFDQKHLNLLRPQALVEAQHASKKLHDLTRCFYARKTAADDDEGQEALAPRVTTAGSVFVGEASGTAFGDYIAGSNHVLPTNGAARFASSLSPQHFRRHFAEVRIGDGAPGLARAAAPVARAEGFELHARSLETRIRDNGTQ